MLTVQKKRNSDKICISEDLLKQENVLGYAALTQCLLLCRFVVILLETKIAIQCTQESTTLPDVGL
jgi:hypothetical protein